MSTTTSAALVKLIASAHLQPVARATALAQLDRQSRFKAAGGTYMPRTRDFVERFAQVPDPNSAKKPSHPADFQTVGRRRTEGPLSAAEMAWLQRLPSDPTQVPFEDAAEVANLVAKVSRMKDPAGARLLTSVWQPIADYHDRRVAQDRLARARQPLPTIPSGALDALIEAVKIEDPTLPDDVIVSRANTLLRTTLDKRSDDYIKEQHDAQAAMQALDDAIAKRKEVAR